MNGFSYDAKSKLFVHLDHESSNALGKSCLSPLSMIKIYDPKALNGSASKPSPIYHSSIAPENAGADQKQNEPAKRTDVGDLSLDDLSNIQISPSTFMNMCPALLVQIEQRSCKDDGFSARSQIEHNHADGEHDHDDHGHHHDEPKQPKQKEISTYGKSTK